MKKLIFATNNKNKLREVSEMLYENYELSTPKDFDITEDIPETCNTIKGNASQKSHYIHDRVKVNCFADDTGLEVDALNGAPGVYSARYAGEDKSSESNMNLLLENLDGNTNRKARFRTVISLILSGNEYLFEGIVDGRITNEKSGCAGFGYDPIFIPDGYDITFAEMDSATKNAISHRGRAVQQLVDFLNSRTDE